MKITDIKIETFRYEAQRNEAGHLPRPKNVMRSYAHVFGIKELLFNIMFGRKYNYSSHEFVESGLSPEQLIPSRFTSELGFDSVDENDSDAIVGVSMTNGFLKLKYGKLVDVEVESANEDGTKVMVVRKQPKWINVIVADKNAMDLCSEHFDLIIRELLLFIQEFVRDVSANGSLGDIAENPIFEPILMAYMLLITKGELTDQQSRMLVPQIALGDRVSFGMALYFFRMSALGKSVLPPSVFEIVNEGKFSFIPQSRDEQLDELSTVQGALSLTDDDADFQECKVKITNYMGRNALYGLNWQGRPKRRMDGGISSLGTIDFNFQ